MLDVLEPDGREALARALHAQVHAPATAAERRWAELGLLARLLDEHPQKAAVPYVKRQVYDRAAEAAEAPPSERLVERFGSWRRVCWAAWGLLSDGRSAMGGLPYQLNRPDRRGYRPYTVEEALASVCACSEALRRLPSSSAYHKWAREKKQQARASGQESRVVRMSIVLRLLAPADAPPREKWLMARARALEGHRP